MNTIHSSRPPQRVIPPKNRRASINVIALGLNEDYRMDLREKYTTINETMETMTFQVTEQELRQLRAQFGAENVLEDING